MPSYISIEPYNIQINGIAIDDPYVLGVLSQGQHPEILLDVKIISALLDSALIPATSNN